MAFSRDANRILTGGQDQGGEASGDAQTGTLSLEAKGMDELRQQRRASARTASRLVAGWEDNTAKVIDAETGAVLLVLKGRPRVANVVFLGASSGVLGVAFSPDGTRIVTGGTTGVFGTGEASVWDARTGAELLELRGHTGIVASVAFSPDGTRIITGSADGTAKVWDARTGTPRLELEGVKGHMACASFSPDCKWIVTSGGDFVGKSGEAQWSGTHGPGMPKCAL